MRKDQIIVVNLSGRGDKDVALVVEFEGSHSAAPAA
jgi:tryptophan synthase beta subunit